MSRGSLATRQMSDSSSSDGEDTWIQWFCGLEGHEMFCEIDRGYIEDAFNLYGLRHFVPRINDSLDLILDRTGERGQRGAGAVSWRSLAVSASAWPGGVGGEREP